MTRVYLARDPQEAHLLVGLLKSHGIEAVVQGEELWGVRGELPFGASSAPSLWVAEEDALKAREIVLSAPRQVEPGGKPWTCAKCGERLEAQFTSCWNCGAGRPESPRAGDL
jgi:hypothetical protein